MRTTEVDYWNKEAIQKTGKNYRDNIFKRQAIARRIYDINWINQNVLEIGIGLGIIAATIRIITLNNVNYVATDVSDIYAKHGKERLGIDVRHTDILNLPTIDGGFTRVLALDSLEHVRPEDREQGYKNISNVMAEHSTIIMNIPCEDSYHDPEFDYGFTMSDLDVLRKTTNTELIFWERYVVKALSGDITYVWAILGR